MSGAGAVRRLPRETRWSPRASGDEALAREWERVEAARAALHREAVEVAFELAERVLAESASLELAVALVGLRAALASHRWEGAVLVRVHGASREACEASLAQQPVLARVCEDASLGEGDVVLEGRAGVVDARLVARLRALRSALELQA